MPIEDLESGARIDVSDIKRDPLDFALWKAAKPGEICWDSPWGKGRPGWHIECSAMSRRYLGRTIDIHCGGQDLTFPHHENEIAQSECANGCTFSRFWVHNGFININNEKMSKSAGNFFTVRDIADKYGYMPIRFFLLSSHYRSPVNFSEDIMKQSAAAVERIANCAADAEFYLNNAADEGSVSDELRARLDSIVARFDEVMDDDFNTADGIACIFDAVREVNAAVKDNAGKAVVGAAYDVFGELASLMGLLPEKESADDSLTARIEEMISRRAEAKKARDYAAADAIRAELTEMGVILEDTPQGTKYKLK
jgi:cysteinyl-tRNA synthetase